MATYRIYVVEGDGHIARMPAVLECETDAEALVQANKAPKGRDIELWQGERFIEHVEQG